MDIFCDIYFVLIENKEEHLDRRLLNLLQTVRLSVTISRLFGVISAGFTAAVLFLICMPLLPEIKLVALSILVLVYGYKTIEFLKLLTAIFQRQRIYGNPLKLLFKKNNSNF